MGQYYRPLLIDGKGNTVTLNAHAFNNGLKLMEHSYIGNNLVNIVMSLAKDEPQTIAWMGDYADSGFDYCTDRTKENVEKYYSSAWNHAEEDEYEAEKAKQVELYGGEREKLINPDCENKGYLINRTKMLYIDLTAYSDENKWEETYFNHAKKEEEKYFMCISPLPLLTACGNGNGGGDYRGKMLNKVGSWAFDEIEFSFDKPDDLAEVKYTFKEER